MDADDRENFFVAAELFQCWIGVRDPNELAGAWAKETGYIPKPEWCKAKTADNPDPEVAHLAGLVVDPTVRPEAFENLERAEQKWGDFLENGQLPEGFTRVE